MKQTIIIEACKGKDLEKGDKFYVYFREHKEYIVMRTPEHDKDYGVAITDDDNLFFRYDDIFITKKIT